MNKNDQLITVRIISFVSIILLVPSFYKIVTLMEETGIVFTLHSRRWIFIFGLGLIGIMELVFSILAFTPFLEMILSSIERNKRKLSKFRKLVWILIGLVISIYLFAVYGPVGELFLQTLPRIWIFLTSVVGISILFKLLYPFWNTFTILSLTTLTFSLIHIIFAHLYNVNNYPFSLWWSETSRYYYASLFYSKRIYGLDIPPSVLHPSRYLMQAIPFIISELPLWVHRLWQVLLWLILPVITAISLGRRLSIKGRGMFWLFVAWAFLFLFQGPVYYHLLVPVIIVLIGFNQQKIPRTFLIVVIASAWAGFSRINWFPVPGILAATLYFIERPKGKNPLWRYLSPAILWVGMGTFIALISQTVYVILSGNDPNSFTSSFTADLLWYRLLPNSTYPFGLLIGILLVSLPLLTLILIFVRIEKNIGWYVRWLGIASLLFVLLAGGLLVSTKIGGGSNLHNLDAYITLLLVVGSYLIFDQYVNEPVSPINANTSSFSGNSVSGKISISKYLSQGIFTGRSIPRWLIVLMIIIPALIIVNSGGTRKLPEKDSVELILNELNLMIDEVVQKDGEVLFISQRHLILFGLVNKVDLIPDYEKVFFMEMVMAKNETYLSQFYKDVSEQKYDLIIIDRLSENFKGTDLSFSDEHNVWVKSVTLPLLETYRRRQVYREAGFEILEPKS